MACERAVLDGTRTDTDMDEEATKTDTQNGQTESVPEKTTEVEAPRKLSEDEEIFVLPPTLLWKAGLRIRAPMEDEDCDLPGLEAVECPGDLPGEEYSGYSRWWMRGRKRRIVLTAASKLLGKNMKKFANTSRFVVSSKVWLNTIPTRDCDVLMVFPGKTDDQTLMWVLSRLRARTPELAVHVRHHSNTGFYGFYLTANYENLLKGAEELAIRKPVKKEFGGGLKEFVFEDQDYFEDVDDTLNFLTSQERQSIVRHMLHNLRAIDGDILLKVKFVEGQAIVPILISKGIIKEVMPLHNSEDLTFLTKNWVQSPLKGQPLERICNYFGVKIALYFAYLGHYTQALTFPAFTGLIFWIMSGRNQNRDDVIFVLFAIINVVWSTLYLEHWKRRSAEFAYQWGTLDKEDELLVEPRPLFKGSLSRSPVTGRLEANYPSWKRNLFRYFVSMPVILLCLSVVFITMWMIFELQDVVNGRIKEGKLPFFCKFLPKVLLAVSIGILDDIYKKIAFWLNDMENYRLDEAYETHLILKIVLFQFVNSFLSLFYIAFYLQDMDRLKEQLAALLITRQVIGNIKEAVVPYVISKIKLYRIGYQMTEGMSPATLDRHMKEMTGIERVPGSEGGIEEVKEEPKTTRDDIPETDSRQLGEDTVHDDNALNVAESGPTLTQAEVEAGMKTYEDTFEDYLEMLIQFGYVTLFSSAFPMAAMCALVNNVIEVRSDAFKLCCTMKRPFGQTVESIGTWQDGLELMSLIAVIVNCALIGMSGLADRMFPDMGTAERIVFIVLLEHVILVIKMMVAYAIPDIPQWVAEEKARLEFLRREALKKLEGRTVTGEAAADGKELRRSPSVERGTPEREDAGLTKRRVSPEKTTTRESSPTANIGPQDKKEL